VVICTSHRERSFLSKQQLNIMSIIARAIASKLTGLDDNTINQ
jgi:hypothetical protein